MERRTDKEYLERRFGFPLVVKNAPMRRVLNEWVLDVNANELRLAVMGALVFKPAPLTGDEVRAIRLFLERTVSAFGGDCGVTHPAVLKWEATGDQPTSMAAGTEFLVRFLLLNHLAGEFALAMPGEEDELGGESLRLISQRVLPLSRRLTAVWNKRASGRGRKGGGTVPSIVIDSQGRPVLPQ